ncbi:hypothetical protein BY996DRAFT_6427905 [Phakopsora pachyrhizi]|nr:hypothetical protein BY996DRAFT_6427905 [Phakopsora pachyrhizi]
MLLANSSRPRALQSSTPITKMANLTTAVVVETKFNKDFVGLCQEDIIGSMFKLQQWVLRSAKRGTMFYQGISGGSDQGLMNWAKALNYYCDGLSQPIWTIRDTTKYSNF